MFYRGNWLGNRTRLVGLQIYVGNIYANGVWFSGFEKSSSYDAVGAMGWVKNTSARDVDGVMNALYDFTNVRFASYTGLDQQIFSA